MTSRDRRNAEDLNAGFGQEVSAWRAQGLGRSLAAHPKPGAGASDSVLDFTSNDYLGLSAHPDIKAGAIQALEAHGASGRASRLLGGGPPDVLAVEQKLADWLGAESALLMPSGYQTNMTLLPAIAGRGDVIVSDELNHASLIDGMRLSGAHVRVYAHGDVENAARLLKESAGASRRYLVTEAVFSMDGDVAPLAALERTCATHGAGLIVDEAHAAGVLGPAGRGGSAAAEITPLARIVTGGKALGAAGGIVAGSRALIELLIHRGRGFVFSTAVSPALVGALDVAIDIVAAADSAREQVLAHARSLSASLGSRAPDAAIVPILIGDSKRAVEAQAALLAEGFDVRAVRPPTVPEGTARLRVVCRATQSPESLVALGDAIQPLLDDRAALLEPSATVPSATVPSATVPSATEVSATEVSATEPSHERPLVIVGTDTDVGKTVVSALTALALDARYWKPVQTGDDSDTETVEHLAGATQAGTDVPRAIAPPRYWFKLPASPHTAAAVEGASVDVDEIELALEAHAAQAAPQRLVVELAGGLLVPLNEDATQADWIARKRSRALRPELLLVARSALGTLNHTLLTIEALRVRGLAPKALVLVGEPHQANADTLRPLVPALFELPILPSLSRSALIEWLDDNDLGSALND